MERYISLALLVLGYCLIRCATPSLAKPAHAMATPSGFADDECSSNGEPCEFYICPGEIFRAICDQFSLVNTNSHPLKVTDIGQTSACCKGQNCTAPSKECNVPTEELVNIIKETTNCFTSPNCVIKHPETLLKLEDRFCNMTTKILSGFYYCN